MFSSFQCTGIAHLCQNYPHIFPILMLLKIVLFNFNSWLFTASTYKWNCFVYWLRILWYAKTPISSSRFLQIPSDFSITAYCYLWKTRVLLLPSQLDTFHYFLTTACAGTTKQCWTQVGRISILFHSWS